MHWGVSLAKLSQFMAEKLRIESLNGRGLRDRSLFYIANDTGTIILFQVINYYKQHIPLGICDRNFIFKFSYLDDYNVPMLAGTYNYNTL